MYLPLFPTFAKLVPIVLDLRIAGDLPNYERGQHLVQQRIQEIEWYDP